jgi:hypothetical protein
MDAAQQRPLQGGFNTPLPNANTGQQPISGSAPYPYNAGAWGQLPEASKNAQGIEAVLLVWNANASIEQPAWLFLINPRSLQYKNQARYSPVGTLASSADYQAYNNTGGRTLTIPDLAFSTWLQGKSLRPLIQGLEALLQAKGSLSPDNKSFTLAPPILRFRFGSEDFSPCILMDVSYEITAWLGGEPARAKVSLTLKEIPKPLTPAQQEARRKERVAAIDAVNRANNVLAKPLTARQQDEAKKKAEEYLKANIDVWGADVQAALNSKKYSLSVDPNTGYVSLKDAQGNNLGTVARYDGKDAIAGANTTTLSTLPGKQPTTLKATPAAPEAGATTAAPAAPAEAGAINNNIVKGMQARGSFDTRNIPGVSTKSQAAAASVDQVLIAGGIPSFKTNSVENFRTALQEGRGQQVTDRSTAKAGDLAIIPGQHMGICLNDGCTHIKSNSERDGTFSWISDQKFGPAYNQDTEVWRVVK